MKNPHKGTRRELTPNTYPDLHTALWHVNTTSSNTSHTIIINIFCLKIISRLDKYQMNLTFGDFMFKYETGYIVF